MASDSQLLTTAGVLVILLGIVAYNTMAARRPQRPEAQETTATWIAKFVHHDGHVVGETVAVTADALILKQAGVFKSVPKAQAKDHGDEIELEGAIDWDQAIAAGTAWHEAHTKGHDPAVSEQLTTSSDVRAPALEAFRRRQEEE